MTVLLLAVAPGAGAHVTEVSDGFRISFGWGDEPAYSDAQNFVQVLVADNRSGARVAVAAGTLAVQVAYGDARVTLPLVPAEGQRGEYDAVLVPTEPGAYAFHVSGSVNGRTIDVAAACSERTFDCVLPASDVQFPTRTASGAELAQGLARERLRAQRASVSAANANTIAVVAVAIAALALAAAVAIALAIRVTRAR